jgi:diguanylate cyclase (GGDEF)-like protein
MTADAHGELTSELANDIAVEIDRLRTHYVGRLPEEFIALEVQIAALDGREKDRKLLENIHHCLHKLTGSGGTFGLAAMSTEAREAENLVKSWLEAPHLIAVDAARAALLGVLSRLREAGTHNTVTPSAVNTTSSAPFSHQATGEQRLNLWLVEPDAQVGEELVRALTQFGYQVRRFAQPYELAAAIVGARPDALIIDIGDAAGMAISDTVSHTLITLNCPLLLVSEHGDFESRASAARLGASGFLVKPIDAARLVDHLERIFDAQQALPCRVLIVDDDAPLAEHFRLVLCAAGMEVDVLSEPARIIERVATFRPELVLLDVNMPGHSGPELATVIRHHDEWLSLPIVYLSAETDLSKQIKALNRGADDFITKPVSDPQLVAAVRVRVARSRQLGELMSKDSLTGLLKHSRIKEKIVVEVGRARRNGTPVSVAMIDIDHFKSVNDTYGHAVGDSVIKAIAHLLRQRLRKSDTVGRYGGEEFVAVLPECDEATAKQILDDIRERFGALRFRHDGIEFASTLSAGVACSTTLSAADGNELLIAADAALYTAKHAGRNQVRVAGE